MASVSSSVLRMEEIAGKGRGLVAAQPLKAGQTVLTESPLILYSAHPLFASPVTHCDHCFRSLSCDVVPCPSCPTHCFCSRECLSLALASSHSAWACKVLSSLTEHPHCSSLLQEQPPERQVQARFVVAVQSLILRSPLQLHTLLSLHGTPDDSVLRAAQFLHSLISLVCELELSVDLTAQVLAKDRLNSFCLMDPYSPDGPQRCIKAYAIYPKSTFFNHSCIPNACRFDYVDRHDTNIVFRMIVDVAEGEEVCISYFRINRDYCTRKRILMEDYGFTCECDRCNVEVNWGGGGAERSGDAPHVGFLRKYVCARKNCAGTLAPKDGDGLPHRLLECNFCGDLKIDTGVH